ncbi:MAG: hypothetical protein O9340_11235 [Cyclobacteriaceae bacterium]|nr:hypothetical protein [Cyclobacteriaceae bacterium]
MKYLSIFLLSLLSFNLSAQKAAEDKSVALKNWIPDELVGLKADNRSFSKEVNNDQGQYLIAVKQFTDGEKAISLVVFDYGNNAAKVEGPTKSWKEATIVEDDKQFFAHALHQNNKAFEQFNKVDNQAQLLIYIANRYLLTVNTNQGLETARNVVAQLKLNQLPK